MSMCDNLEFDDTNGYAGGEKNPNKNSTKKVQQGVLSLIKQQNCISKRKYILYTFQDKTVIFTSAW